MGHTKSFVFVDDVAYCDWSTHGEHASSVICQWFVELALRNAAQICPKDMNQIHFEAKK